MAQLSVGVSLHKNPLEYLNRTAFHLRRLLGELELSLEIANLPPPLKQAQRVKGGSAN